jgi:hypothetical protein
MIGRSSVIGVVMALALAIAAFAAANASAEQRAWTCGSGIGFADAHCLIPNTVSGPFAEIEIPPSVATAISATNAKTASETTASTPSQLSGTLAGVATELECTGVSGTGSLTNAASSVTGTGKLTYTGCVVLKPAGKGCKVTGGTVKTEELKATTVGQAANKLKFEMVGTKFANVEIKECSTTALNNTFPVTGSLIANTNGATTTTAKAEIETQNTLKFGGNKAGLGGAITISDSAGGVVLK